MGFYGQTESRAPKKLHPSLSWANWKNGQFIIWDRDVPSPTPEDPNHKGAEVEYKLPKEFVVIADSWSIKGWLQGPGNVWSNEVYSFANDIFTVKDNDGKVLYQGLWKDIKQDIKAAKLGLTKNLHFFDPAKPDEIRTLCLKGAGLKAWLEVFKDDLRNAPAYSRIALDKIDEGKVGKNEFTYPVFKTGKDLSADDRINQQKLGVELMNYKDSAQAEVEAEEVKSSMEEDNLPF